MGIDHFKIDVACKSPATMIWRNICKQLFFWHGFTRAFLQSTSPECMLLISIVFWTWSWLVWTLTTSTNGSLTYKKSRIPVLFVFSTALGFTNETYRLNGGSREPTGLSNNTKHCQWNFLVFLMSFCFRHLFCEENMVFGKMDNKSWKKQPAAAWRKARGRCLLLRRVFAWFDVFFFRKLFALTKIQSSSLCFVDEPVRLELALREGMRMFFYMTRQVCCLLYHHHHHHHHDPYHPRMAYVPTFGWFLW